MNRKMLPALAGVAAAIVITTTLDATGYGALSALPLLPLALLFWYLQKFSRRDIGLTWGTPSGYAVAVGYPLVVLGSIGLIALLAGVVDASDSDWTKAMLNVALMSTVGILATLLTEEGFFRGWLWAALRRSGRSEFGTIIWTSLP